MCNSIIPIVGLVIAFIIFTLYYDLSEEDVAAMMKEMADKREVLEL